MRGRFRNRSEAGKLLAVELMRHEDYDDSLVIGLARGGVPVAFEIAARLHLPLDVLIVRKIGVPGHDELALGAVASGDSRVMNEDVISSLRIAGDAVEAAVRRELEELVRIEALYRNEQPMQPVEGRKVILVDDGVATGASMLAAIAALRKQLARRVVLAVPTMPAAAVVRLEAKADELLAIVTPEEFWGVAEWYDDFAQTNDTEVRGLLEKARRARAA